MSNTDPLVVADRLTKYFPLPGGRNLHAVEAVSLTIHEREIVGLVGESGSGKSTFGKALIGLLPKTGGQVSFRGEALPQKYGPADFRRHSKAMQMVFQDPYSSLNPRMTVGEIIGEGLRLQTSLSRGEIREKVAGWLTRVGLEPDHMSRYPHEFSGGQRQRIGIARALILEPEFVVCDEPISALDVSVQAQVVNLLEELKETMGLTLLFIAHDLSMVRYVSDRIAVLYLGALAEIGPAADVFFEPRHPYTQALIASNPEPDPETERARPSPEVSGEISSPVDVGEGCRFAARCPHVMDICRTKTPLLKPIRDDQQRRVACHLFD